MRQILDKQPEMLRFYGMDPDEIKKELKESDTKTYQINNVFD